MIIVAGTFDVAPGDRDEFLAIRRDLQLYSRTEPGCIEYVFSADSIDPGRVRLFELWQDQASLDAHGEALRRTREAEAATGGGAEAAVAILARDILVYELGETPPRPL